MSSTFRRIHGWLAQLTGASALVAAAGFHVTIALAGPELATGLLFYGGETEAVPTPLPHPWIAVLPVLVLGGTATIVSWVRKSPPWGWAGLVAAGLAVAQGVLQILALMDAARP